MEMSQHHSLVIFLDLMMFPGWRALEVTINQSNN